MDAFGLYEFTSLQILRDLFNAAKIMRTLACPVTLLRVGDTLFPYGSTAVGILAIS